MSMIPWKQQPVNPRAPSVNRSSIVLLVVHIGGGLWGIFAVPIFRRTIGANATGNFASNTVSIIYWISNGESWRVG